MSTKPRIASLDGAPANFANVTAHAAPIMQRFFSLYATLWQQGALGDELRELARIRNARITDCGY